MTKVLFLKWYGVGFRWLISFSNSALVRRVSSADSFSNVIDFGLQNFTDCGVAFAHIMKSLSPINLSGNIEVTNNDDSLWSFTVEYP